MAYRSKYGIAGLATIACAALIQHKFTPSNVKLSLNPKLYGQENTMGTIGPTFELISSIRVTRPTRTNANYIADNIAIDAISGLPELDAAKYTPTRTIEIPAGSHGTGYVEIPAENLAILAKAADVVANRQFFTIFLTAIWITCAVFSGWWRTSTIRTYVEIGRSMVLPQTQTPTEKLSDTGDTVQPCLLTLQEEFSTLRGQLAHVQSENANLTADNRILEVQLDVSRTDVTDLRARVDAGQEIIQGFERQVVGFQEQAPTLETDLATARRQNDTLITQAGDLQRRLSASNEAVTFLNAALEDRQHTIRTSSRQIVDRDAKLIEAKEEKAAALSDNTSFWGRILIGDTAHLQMKIQKQAKALEKQGRKLGVARKVLRDTKAEVEDKMAQIELQEAENKRLKEEVQRVRLEPMSAGIQDVHLTDQLAPDTTAGALATQATNSPIVAAAINSEIEFRGVVRPSTIAAAERLQRMLKRPRSLDKGPSHTKRASSSSSSPSAETAEDTDENADLERALLFVLDST
ncbi:hypothetical protein K490DRAFT_59908 [Saccharata proteae CBS 121410]|uniref:Uncharacterized protein n=1 Tax=Saccharata proteae CBS 121410 TaxID=1314787 RepID=A0A9P4LS21_9PEZI|nr:hypothetical protein K490DRAFT_59908 [Saccharata proteae CBS 121410]